MLCCCAGAAASRPSRSLIRSAVVSSRFERLGATTWTPAVFCGAGFIAMRQNAWGPNTPRACHDCKYKQLYNVEGDSAANLLWQSKRQRQRKKVCARAQTMPHCATGPIAWCLGHRCTQGNGHNAVRLAMWGSCQLLVAPAAAVRPRPPAGSRHCLLKSYLQSRCSRAPTKALQSCKLKSGVMCHQRWRCGAAAAGCNLSNAAASKAGSARHGMCRCIRNTKLKSPALPSSQAGLIEGPRHPGHTPLTAPGAAYCWTAAWRCTAESRRCPPAPAPAVFCAGGGRRGRGSRHSRNLGPPT